MSEPLLEVRGLEAGYGATRVLFGVDLKVRAGAITALLGANGAGKTTTLRALCGLIRRRGEVRLAGKRIDTLATEDIVRLGVAHVPDGRGTFTGLTTEENLRMGACTRRDRAGVREDFERLYEFFPRLKERCRQQAGTLSGGEQQMLAIARALMLRPRLLLLDEPSFGLAPIVVEDIFAIMRRISEASRWPSSWWSRTRRSPSIWPIRPICWRRAASSSPDPRKRSATIPPCATSTSATNGAWHEPHGRSQAEYHSPQGGSFRMNAFASQLLAGWRPAASTRAWRWRWS